MNPNGSQLIQDQADELKTQIVELTQYKPDKPTDLFQYYHPEIRKQFVDAYNLSRIWLQGFLYWKGVYPQEAFEMKTAFSRKIFVVKSKTLRQYLDRFFESVCQNFEFVDFIEIRLVQEDENKKQRFVEGERFRISFTKRFSTGQEVHQIKKKGLNTLQKQIEYKRFIGKMQEQMNQGYYRPRNTKCTFRLLMGYKWDHKNKNSKHHVNLLNKWTEKQQQILSRTETLNHAGTDQLEVVCERFSPSKSTYTIEPQ